MGEGLPTRSIAGPVLGEIGQRKVPSVTCLGGGGGEKEPTHSSSSAAQGLGVAGASSSSEGRKQACLMTAARGLGCNL